MTTAYLGLGGNIGDPRRAMRAALRALDATHGVRVLAASRIFRTPPWGKIDQPPFQNAAAKLDTTLQPEELLDACLQIERNLKRERLERWGPRTIDLDILDIDGAIVRDDRLTLPHPRMAERAFVLVPLADIAPGLLIAGGPLIEQLNRLDRSGIEPITPNGGWWRSEEPDG